MTELTARQRQVLDCIRAYTVERGYPPTVREIGAAVGLRSPATVQHHLVSLELAGVIRRDPTRPRTLVINEVPA